MRKILILLLLIVLSVLKADAFLNGNLGLDLYKDLDKGIYKLEKTQLEYELKGGKEITDVTKFLNKQLEIDGYKKCLKPGLTTQKIEHIINYSNIKELVNNLKNECVKDGISIKDLNNYMSSIKRYRDKANNRAINKSINIYEISKIGLYTDGNPNNGQFDIIVDLQELDKIFLGEDLEYNGEEGSNFLDEFEDDPFSDSDIDLNDNGSNSGNANGGANSGANGGANSGSGTNTTNSNGNNSNGGNPNNTDGNNNNNQNASDPNNTDGNTQNNINENVFNNTSDGNTYICPANNDQSGLSQEELYKIQNKVGNNTNNLTNKNITSSGANSNYLGNVGNPKAVNFIYVPGTSGHLKLPDTNQININSIGNYMSVNDNSQWNCTPQSFFCITIDFKTNNQKALGYTQKKSIINLLKKSNEHLKKAANTSLLQAKMGTNNFENTLRDLDFSKMFHMGVQITKKSPPILNLERKKDEVVYSNSESNGIFKKRLEKRYKNQELDYKRKNDLTLLTKKEKKLRDIINTAESNPSSLIQKEKKRNQFLKNLEQENDFTNKKQISLLNKATLTEFYTELLEYEKFIGSIESYTNNIMSYIKHMYKIPRGD